MINDAAISTRRSQVARLGLVLALGLSTLPVARVDLRLARHFGEQAEISLVGQNLLRPRSTEYGNSHAIIGTQSVRSVFAQIAWRF